MPSACCKATWEKVKDTDEPVFILRAQDVVALETVRNWIESAEDAGTDEAKLQQAEEHAEAFVAWQEAHPEKVKIPD